MGSAQQGSPIPLVLGLYVYRVGGMALEVQIEKPETHPRDLSDGSFGQGLVPTP